MSARSSARVASIADAPSAVRERVARNRGDRLSVALLVPVAMLLVVGLGALMSASSVVALQETGDKLFYFKRQIMWIGLGVLAMGVTVRLPYRLYARFSFVILILSFAGLIATLAIGDVRFGARRWIEIGPFTLQASEFSKFAVIVFLARAFARKEKYLVSYGHFIWPVLLSVGLTGILLLGQPDLGTTLIIGGSAFAVMVASLVPIHFIVGTGLAGVLGVAVLARTADYRWARIEGFLNPLADPLGNGLQAVQSLVALGTGGWFGVGLGASRARWFFLPNAHTDFIFAIIGEEIGLAGSLIVVALLLMFAVVGIVVALRAADVFARLLAIGIVSWLSLQALINIGGVAVVLPITGVPLPFVSSGGSAMIANLAAVGVLINIARNSQPHATSEKHG